METGLMQRSVLACRLFVRKARLIMPAPPLPPLLHLRVSSVRIQSREKKRRRLVSIDKVRGATERYLAH